MESEFDLDGPVADLGPDERERVRIVAEICRVERSWRTPDIAVVLTGGGWLPDLQAPRRRLLHLALTGEVPRSIARRMLAARVDGYDITVALGWRRVTLETLRLLQQVDARVLTVDSERSPAKVVTYRSVSDWIATERICLAPDELRALASEQFDRALEDPTNVKGRLYEETLCLVFSQVQWLTVDEHAYRNASEEIDLVLGVHAVGYTAQLANGAVAIATAKNESTATGSATVKYLKEQMANRKGRCKLGFLCSASTISGDAKTEILRGSQHSDLVIVQVDRDDLRALIEHAETLDERLQDLVRRAVAD